MPGSSGKNDALPKLRETIYREKETMKETTYDKGNISESIVMSAYLKAGFTVSVPFGTGAPYDLVIDNGSRLCKVQVKTGWFRNGCIIYRGDRRVRKHIHMPRDPILKQRLIILRFITRQQIRSMWSRSKCAAPVAVLGLTL